MPTTADDLPVTDRLRIGPRTHSVSDLLFDCADADWLARMKFAHDPPASERAATRLRYDREAAAPSRVRETAGRVLSSAMEILKREQVRLNAESVAQVILKYSSGRLDRSAADLVIAAANCLMARELLSALPDSDQSATERPPSWRAVELALSLGLWLGAADLHEEINVKRGTGKATAKRKSAAEARVTALAEALRTRQVKSNIEDVLRWRGEERNRATAERARRDLKAATSARTRTTTRK